MRPVRGFLLFLYVFFTIAACVLLPFASTTAGAAVAEDFRLWGNVTAQGNFGFVTPDWTRVRWWMDGQARARESGEKMDQLFIRPGIGYALTDRSTVWIGYAYAITYPAVGDTIRENRMWQQYTWSGPTILGAFTSRTRLEQRWQDNGDDTGWRFRQSFRFNRPFSFYPAASFVVSDEVFVNMNSTDWGAREGFDQNRVFAGIGYRWHPSILTECGYMNQYIHTANIDRMNHILSLNLFLDF